MKECRNVVRMVFTATWVSLSISSLKQALIMAYNIVFLSGSLLFYSLLTEVLMFDHSSVSLTRIYYHLFYRLCSSFLWDTYWIWEQMSWLRSLLLWLAGSRRVQSHRVLGWSVRLGCFVSRDSWRPSAGPPVPRIQRSAVGHTAQQYN